MIKTLVFGGLSIEIGEPRYKAARAWRARLQSEIAPLIDALGTNVGDFSDLSSLRSAGIDKLAHLLAGSIDTAFNLLIEFAPALSAKRDEIADVATDQEIIAAFVEVVKIAYPFGSVVRGMSNLSGAAAQLTGKN